jgi:hypothetical protein
MRSRSGRSFPSTKKGLRDRRRIPLAHVPNRDVQRDAGADQPMEELASAVRCVNGIAQLTVARYMYRGWPPSQGWRTFLTNHVDGIAAIDLFVLPTITFRQLYCLVILRHGRRLWVSFGITTNPTAVRRYLANGRSI